MKHYDHKPPFLGGASLLASFAVLMLTMLALLSLNQVWMDRNQAKASEEAVAEYYAADIEAEKILAMLRSGAEVKGTTNIDGIWHYSCPISEDQTLFVEVDGESWEILRWEAVAHPEAPADTLPVWEG